MFSRLESKITETKEEGRKQYNELSAKLKDRNNRLEVVNRLQRNQTQTILDQMNSFKEEFTDKYNEVNNRVNEIKEESSLKLNELDEQLKSQNYKLETLQNQTQQQQIISIKETELSATESAKTKTETETKSDEDFTDKLNELNSKLNEIRHETLNNSQQVNELTLNLNNLNYQLETVHFKNQTNYESQLKQFDDELNSQNNKIELVTELIKTICLNQTRQLEVVTEQLNQLKKENEQKYDELKAKLNDQYEEFNDKINENKSLIFYPLKKESESVSDQKESNDLLNELRKETHNRYTELTNTLSQQSQLIQSHDLKFNQIELLISNQSDLFSGKLKSLKLETEQFNFRLNEIRDENKNQNDLLVSRMDSVVNSVTTQTSVERTGLVKNRFSLSAISYSLSHDISIKNLQSQGYQVK